jgi:hypothetical protein
VTGTGAAEPGSNVTREVSITALMAKALLVWRRHSVQWQQLTNIGAESSRYITAPQKQEPVLGGHGASAELRPGALL